MAAEVGNGEDRVVSVRIVVVDDDAGFRRVAVALCRARGLDVVGEGSDIESALRAVELLHPDGVLMDISLPDGTGLDAAAGMHLLPAPPRVLLMSTDPDAWPPDDIARSGAAGFIPKDQLSEVDLVALFATPAETAAPQAPAGAGSTTTAAGSAS